MSEPARPVPSSPPRRGGWPALVGHWTLRELALASILCPVVALGGAILSERLYLEGHVMPGVELDHRDVSGLALPALEDLVMRRHRAVSAAQFRVVVGQATFPLAASEIGGRIDVPRVVDEVMRAGRGGGGFGHLRWRLARLGSKAEFRTQVTFDPNAWEQHLADYENTALSPPREGGLDFDASGVRSRMPIAGDRLDRGASTKLILEALESGATDPIVLPMVASQPRTTPEMVRAATSRAEQLLAGPLTLSVEVPEGTLPSGIPVAADGSLPSETISRSDLSSALEAVVTDAEPPTIQIRFRSEGLEQLLEPLRKRWEQPATDARFVVNSRHQIRIEPSKVQTRLESQRAGEQILEAAGSTDRRATLRLVLADPPRLTTERAHELGIEKFVAQFTTHHPCCRPRVKNIHRIADLIDGAVVLPGETFSVNERVGPRIASNGFVPAPTIVHGEMQDTVGGGVSQFATTIFNAVFNGGYEIVERQPHTFYFPRYPVGHEATLSFPKPDFIFRNDTKSGVLLVTEYGATYIRVKVFGNDEGRRVKRAVSPRFDLVDPPVEWEANDELEPDEQKVLARGAKGWSVTVSRTVTEATGEQRTQSRKVTYNPRVRRIAVHSCKIPEGEPGHSSEPCPEPDDEDATELAGDATALPPLDVEPSDSPPETTGGDDEGY